VLGGVLDVIGVERHAGRQSACPASAPVAWCEDSAAAFRIAVE
jgi:hypothetical protein